MRLPDRFYRRAALVAAALVLAAAAVYSVAWMYYTGVRPSARLGVVLEDPPRASELLDAVVATVTEFSGPVQEDDLTLVVLRGLE